MITQGLKTNATHMRSVLNKGDIHFMNLTEGAVMQYEFQLDSTNRVKLDNIFGSNKIHGDIEGVEQSLLVDWGDGHTTEVYTEVVQTSANNTDADLVIEHVYDVPMGQTIKVSIVSEYESFVVKPYFGDTGLTMKSMAGTIANFKTLNGGFDPILRTIERIDTLLPFTGETLFNRYSGTETSFQLMFYNFTKLDSVAEDIFRFNCEHVTRVYSMFGNTKLSSLSSRLFENMIEITDVSRLLYNNKAIKSVGNILEACYKVTNVSEMFKGCSNLETVHDDIFKEKILTDATSVLEGTKAKSVLFNKLFWAANTTDIDITEGMKDITLLTLTDDTFDAFVNTEDFVGTFENSGTKVETIEEDGSITLVDRSFNTGVFQDVVFTDVERAFKRSEGNTAPFAMMYNEQITLVGDAMGHVNLREFLANRNIEVSHTPFLFDESVVTIDYTDCFKNCKSLYPDQVIFGKFYNSDISSGLIPIDAVSTYTITTTEPNQMVRFLSPHNNLNPDFTPEVGAHASIDFGNGERMDNFDFELDWWMTTNGLYEHEYANPGTYTITTTNRWCGNWCPVYWDGTETYDIVNANIQLFPTRNSYMGYGLELFNAKSVGGDFYKLFYDRMSFLPDKEDGDGWLKYLMAGFKSRCISIDNGILNSERFLNSIGSLRNIFTNRYPRDGILTYVNPFNTVTKDVFTPVANKVGGLINWFEPAKLHDYHLVDISESDIRTLCSEFVNLDYIEGFLSSCSLRGSNNNIDWSNCPKIHTIIKAYGKKDWIDWSLIMKDKVSRINFLNIYPLTTGMSKHMFYDKFLDFSQVDGNVDISNMFYDEKFELPDNFIRNVAGTLTYNNCFHGSFRFDVDNDSSLFENIGTFAPSNNSGLEIIRLEAPFVMSLEDLTDKSVNLECLFKDKHDDTPNRYVVRIMSNGGGYMNRLDFTLHDTDLNGFSKVIPLVGDPFKIVVEVWCRTANAVIDTLEEASVKYIEGYYGADHWKETGKMKDYYPGLEPTMIKSSYGINAGPWKNTKDVNGVLNLSGLFEDTDVKGFIDSYIFVTSASKGSTVKLDYLFRGSYVDVLDIRVFTEMKDVYISGVGMFERTTYPGFRIDFIPDDEPYLFMETLFTKFVTAEDLFKHSPVPKDLFNGATYWGCNKDGSGMVSVEDQSLTSIGEIFSNYQGPEDTSEEMVGYFPVFKKDHEYKAFNVHVLCYGRKLRLRPGMEYAYMPNVNDKTTWFSGNSFFRPDELIGDVQEIVIDKFHLGGAHDVNYSMYPTEPFTKIKLLNDYHWITTDDINYATLSARYMFRSDLVIKGTNEQERFLIEPFAGHTRMLLSENMFKPFKTYAPDNILLRNTGGFDKATGATKLDYPNYIEYRNISLTGTTLVFEREELDPDHRASTYLTVNVCYDGTNWEEEWYIVDKDDDTYTVTLDPAKIVDNSISVKIQSTQCFYLTKTNVDKVERLDGSYRKNLQPEDSEFFNWKAQYYYFIEHFGGDLWEHVKISGTIRFAYGNYDCKLTSIGSRPFRTQSHLISIRELFRHCWKYNPDNDILFGLVNVEDASLVFADCGNTTTGSKLQYVPKVRRLEYIFANNSGELTLTEDAFKYSVNAYTLYAALWSAQLTPETVLTEAFFNNISDSVINMEYMFYNVTGLNKVNRGMSIEWGSITLRENMTTHHMFENCDLLDVPIEIVKEGNLLSENSVDMFKGLHTFSDQTEFEAIFGDQTGISYRNSEAVMFMSARGINLADVNFELLQDTDDLDSKSVKCMLHANDVSQGDTYYKTLREMTNFSGSGTVNQYRVFCDKGLLLNHPEVTELHGSLPGTSMEINENSQIGKMYPNLTYIDPKLFANLTEQTSFDSVFEELSNINIVPDDIFKYNTKLTSVRRLFMNAKNTLYDLHRDLFKYNPLINDFTSAFENVNVTKVYGNKINNLTSPNVNISRMFYNTRSLICDGWMNYKGNLDVTDAFYGSKSLFDDDELFIKNKFFSLNEYNDVEEVIRTSDRIVLKCSRDDNRVLFGIGHVDADVTGKRVRLSFKILKEEVERNNIRVMYLDRTEETLGRTLVGDYYHYEDERVIAENPVRQDRVYSVESLARIVGEEFSIVDPIFTDETFITGNSQIEKVNSFKPVLEVTEADTNAEVFILHDNPDDRLMEMMVDWGDGNTQLFTAFDRDSTAEHSTRKTFASTGNKRVRIWCNHYGVAPRIEGETKSLNIKYAGGYVGKHVWPKKFFVNSYLPELKSIESEFTHDLRLSDFEYLFLHSVITHLPPRMFKRTPEAPKILDLLRCFEGLRELKTVDVNLFEDFNNGEVHNSPKTLNVNSLFYECYLLNNLPIGLFEPFKDMNYNLSLFQAMFTYCTKLTMMPEIFTDPILSRSTSNIYRAFDSTGIINIPENFLSGTLDNSINGFYETFKNMNNLVIERDFVIPVSKLKNTSGGSISFVNLFAKEGDIRRYDYRVMDYKEDLVLDITDAMKNNASIFTEEEIFGDNQISGNSGLITDPRRTMKLTVSAGLLSLKATPYIVCNDPILFKKNGKVLFVKEYTYHDVVQIQCEEDDIIEIITFNNKINVYYSHYQLVSESKIKKLGGVFNVPVKYAEGEPSTYWQNIETFFGNDIEEIEDGFFSLWSNIENVSGLCKGLYKLKKVGPKFMDDFPNVTDWTSFFENCESLQLTNENELFFEHANKGVTFDYMFKNCYGLTSIPNRFFKGCLEPEKTFINTFSNCNNITSYPEDIDDF